MEDTAQQLVAKLVMHSYDEQARVVAVHAKWEYQRGYFDGLDAGEQRGYLKAQNYMRRAMGIPTQRVTPRPTYENFDTEVEKESPSV